MECDSSVLPLLLKLSRGKFYRFSKFSRNLKIDIYESSKSKQSEFSLLFNEALNQGHLIVIDPSNDYAVDYFEMFYLNDLDAVA